MQYLMNTYKRYNLCIKDANECTVFDENGKGYIDFSSGIGVNSLGYSNPHILKAIDEQSKKIMHISNLFKNNNDEKLAKVICQKTGGSNVFFSNSGAEANECAIKIARKYSYDKYGEDRFEIITLKNSFHGRTITTLKATGQDKFHKYFMPFTEGFKYAEVNDIDDLKNNISKKTCAIMIELVQGEGGVLPLKDDYVAEVQKICSQNDIMLIIDEVQTGIMRCGDFCAFLKYNLTPDIVTLAKGLGGGVPIGAVIAFESCKDVLGYSDHGSTFGGNPFVTSVALSVVNNLPLKEEINRKSNYIIRKIKDIKSPYIKEIRYKGLMIGIELCGVKCEDIAKKIIDSGVLVLTAGQNTLRLLPPLIISYKDIDDGLKVIKYVLGEANDKSI